MNNTNKKITNAILISFIKILDGVSKKKMPQKISYAITKNIINLSKEYECYITELEKIFNEETIASHQPAKVEILYSVFSNIMEIVDND